MIALKTTWEYVVMFLVAGGVGLIGGLAAALIEGKTRLAAKPPETSHWLLNGTAAVLLGGIAAIAAFLFFLPTKEVVPAEGAKPEQFYELVKLIPLSLIVGSAGTVFLQSFQQRITSALTAQAGEQAAANQQVTAAITKGLPAQTDESLDSAKPNFQTILQNTAIDPGQIDQVASDLVTEAKKAAGEAIGPQVETIQNLTATTNTTYA